jgi:hypothetical protein
MFRIGSKQACALAGLVALGSMSAAHAGDFYFTAFGGVDNYDLPYSRNDLDNAAADIFAQGGIAVNSYKSTLDKSGTLWGVQIGYQFIQYLGMEVGYVNLGRSKYEGTFAIDDGAGGTLGTAQQKFASRGPTLAVVGTLPLGSQRFNVHGRAGVLFSRTDFSLHLEDVSSGDSTGAGVHSSDRELFFGVGGDWYVTPAYALRVEFTRFSKVGSKNETGEANVNSLTIGVLFR